MGQRRKIGSMAEQAAALRSGTVSALELWRDAQTRHEDWGPILDAYKTWTPERGQAAAKAADEAFAAGIDRGPLQGLPVSFKDNFGISDLPIYAGSSRQLPPRWEREGPVVQSVKSQLAVITGKTHTVEFAANPIGDNSHWGSPRNPWDDKSVRVAGGSSSGAGISLWEGSAMAAFGTDTRGSIRIPAAMCGVVGLKMTAGRWSNRGIVPYHVIDDTPGPLTLTVADTAFVFAAINGAVQELPHTLLEKLHQQEPGNLRIGIADTCFWEDCSPGVSEAVSSALGELEGAGATVRDIRSGETGEIVSAWMNGELLEPDLFEFLERELPDWIGYLEGRLKRQHDHIKSLDSKIIEQGRATIERLRNSAPRCFEDVDVIVSPTVPATPPILGDRRPRSETSSPISLLLPRNTCPANYFGWCAITLPVGTDTNRMPVGLQIMAPGGEEEKLLAAALVTERMLGNVHQRLGIPPLLG